jgi:predicted cupin superfamily sugar epimerase
LSLVKEVPINQSIITMLFKFAALVSASAILLGRPASALALEDRASGDEPLALHDTKLTAAQVIEELQLIPNIEKGYFVESFRDTATTGNTNRSASTAIYYLIEGNVGKSIWHRVDVPEVWHYYAGAPLNLYLSNDDGEPVRKKTLGPSILCGQRPQVVIDGWEWQQAESLGAWTLVGTTVAPGFIESGFELAEPDWEPEGSS